MSFSFKRVHAIIQKEYRDALKSAHVLPMVIVPL